MLCIQTVDDTSGINRVNGLSSWRREKSNEKMIPMKLERKCSPGVYCAFALNVQYRGLGPLLSEKSQYLQSARRVFASGPKRISR